jgi:hypothetical protein
MYGLTLLFSSYDEAIHVTDTAGILCIMGVGNECVLRSCQSSLGSMSYIANVQYTNYIFFIHIRAWFHWITLLIGINGIAITSGAALAIKITNQGAQP